MELYKQLGFRSKDELELYEDVCCELNNIKGLEEKEDVVKLLKRVNNIGVFTKKDYEEFINKKGLNELFKKVCRMSLLDRYVELYIYHANCFSFHNSLTAIGVDKIKKTDSTEDGEDLINTIGKTTNQMDESITHLHCIKYIFNKVHTKIPFLEDFFYMATENIHKNIFFEGNNGKNNKKND